MRDSDQRTTAQDGSEAEPLAYSVPKAAAAICVSEAQMWRLVRSGTVKSFKIGTSRRIRRADLAEFIESQAAA